MNTDGINLCRSYLSAHYPGFRNWAAEAVFLGRFDSVTR